MELPIKTQAIVYCRTDEDHKYLILKRSEIDGGYWQPVVGTVKEEESIIQCMLREIEEEAGIKDVIQVSKQLYNFSWERDEQVYLEFVYAIEVDEKSAINLSEEHDEYLWLNYKDAVEKVKYESNKKSITIVEKMLMN
ncbi:NUDIX pyrophosphatase [Candidatus Dojkabacteria bacterium]|jgi:dATP pyrophosphohydrolase|uniref:NUDIX pyrophosphatase n=1 Tax=Candidatus Dojkabacteria bacterium TaxID=2099670 RepID=A0A955L161_9BACT|nr:NUDIX pyrophosphatase [Candidatus Dojkabacteria bacterium]